MGKYGCFYNNKLKAVGNKKMVKLYNAQRDYKYDIVKLPDVDMMSKLYDIGEYNIDNTDELIHDTLILTLNEYVNTESCVIDLSKMLYVDISTTKSLLRCATFDIDEVVTSAEDTIKNSIMVALSRIALDQSFDVIGILEYLLDD